MTIRLRLTLLYAALFLGAGAVLLGITYLFVAHSAWPGEPHAPEVPALDLPGGDSGVVLPSTPRTPPTVDPPDLPDLPDWMEDQRAAQRDEDLRQLLAGSLAALGVMTVGSAALGWVLAGRALRPIATMTATVRRIPADDLHDRLATTGPDDELKDLSDTFDQLLDRLEAAFESQRRFVANASHELRTPLTLQRTLVEVALADPDADAEALRTTCHQVLRGVEDQERLIDALLVLARSQRGVAQRRPVDLTAVVHRLLDDRRGDIAARGLTVTTDLAPAVAAGDPDLLERLTANLLDNATVHNVDGGDGDHGGHDGRIDVSTRATADRAILHITNSGPAIAPERLATLLEPFHADRASASATAADRRGLGLGLSIVDAITRAHRGRLDLRPAPTGGLAVTVSLPRAAGEEPIRRRRP